MESTQYIIISVFLRNSYNYELHHHNFVIDTVLTLPTWDVEPFLFKRGAGPQQIALYTKMLEQTLWYLKMPPEFIDIIGLLVGYKSYLRFYLRYIYLSVCGKYIKPVKPIYELLTLHRPTSFSLVILIDSCFLSIASKRRNSLIVLFRTCFIALS